MQFGSTNSQNPSDMASASPTVITSPEPPTRPFNKSLLKDYYQPMSKESMIKEWETQWSDSLIARDTLLEAMRRQSHYPSVWTTKRESDAGLYPNISDPDFAARLYRKKEFSDLQSVSVADDVCKTQSEFDTTPVQRLVARFLHPHTPYRGLLLDHGVGVGKTCSAITVAEMFLEIQPQNVVTILCPQAIASGFRRTIFDVDRLVPLSSQDAKLYGEVWSSPQCTGMTYPRLTGTANEKNRAIVEKAVDKAIRKRYRIMGYLAFANWVTNKLSEIPKTVTGDAREEAERTLLTQLFSDHLIIVDEAHNLRDVGTTDAFFDETSTIQSNSENDIETESPVIGAASDLAEGKRLTPILQRILRTAEGLRLMMMTATPMYNTAPEILFLLNLLVLNDTKDETQLLKQSDFFNADGALYPSAEETLLKVCGRYISYMRGENPASFPLRLNPPEMAGESLFENYPTISISKMEKTVKLTSSIRKILSMLPLVVHRPSIKTTAVGRMLHKLLSRERGTDEEDISAEEGREITKFLLEPTIQIANITYPDESYGSRGWDVHWKEITAGKVKQYRWTGTEELDDMFGIANISSYAPKISAIIQSITNAKGMCFVFSRYVKAGALPLAVGLERQGWTRVLADGTPAPLLYTDKRIKQVPRQCAFCIHKENQDHVGHTFTPANFILLTGDEGITPDFKGTLQYANTLTNDFETAGGKVKVILGSQITAEGLDLKCIREAHLLDGWFHLNRIEQVEGRAVRYCSHAALPLESRNCLIYLHAVSIPKFETADLYAYRLAARKAIPIGQVQRIIKVSAWDCLMNRDAILLRGLPTRRIVDAQGRVTEHYDLHDRPYTSICDFQERCEYECAVRKIPGLDTSTYSSMDARRRFLEKQKLLREIFKFEIAMPIEFIKRTVYGDMPWEIGSIGLRSILESPHFVVQREDGAKGMLHLQNGYIVFKPLGVTDNEIPMAMRYGRAYARIPRTFVPSNETILHLEAKKVAKKEDTLAFGKEQKETQIAQPKKQKSEEYIHSAMKSLNEWQTILQNIFNKKLSEFISAPGSMKPIFFEGWRFVFHQFRNLDETLPIALQWWMDTEWTLEERNAVLHSWVSQWPTGEDAKLTKGFMPVELFKNNSLTGYQTVDIQNNRMSLFCKFEGETDIQKCPSNMMKDIDAITGIPVDRNNDTGTMFGFLVTKDGNVIFKTVDKEDGKDLRGAQCSQTSNLTNHERRVRIIQTIIRDSVPKSHPIFKYMLDDAIETTPTKAERQIRQEKFAIAHIADLTLKQVCPYMEFLLRWMDKNHINGKRWFLSVVDSARAGVKMA